MRTTLTVLVTISLVALIAVQVTRAAEPWSTAAPLPRDGGANAGIADRVDRASTVTTKSETAVFAGGCFWCTELAFEQLRGVTNVECGYCGGTKATATYDRVHRGTTGHAEAIRVTYDPAKIRYDQLLDVFFDVHDPTQFNRQDEDHGRQYRSAIFFASESEKKQAEAKIAELHRKHLFEHRIVTRLESLATFYPAEDLHQDFARKYPFLPYIQDHAIPKACNVRIKHPGLVGSAP